METILADAKLKVVLTDTERAKRLKGLPQCVVVDESFVERLLARTGLPSTDVKPSNAAWVVYTSGSIVTTVYAKSCHTRASIALYGYQHSRYPNR